MFNMNPSEENIYEVIRNTLEEKGFIHKLKSCVRKEVMTVLQSADSEKGVPRIPDDVVAINELIREYLHWVGYTYTEQALVAESGQTKERTHREVIASKLGVLDNESTDQYPLLYLVLEAFKKWREKMML